jgi:hypothetical protein
LVEDRYVVATRLIGLIGVIGTAGIQVGVQSLRVLMQRTHPQPWRRALVVPQAKDLKRILKLLRFPSRLTRATLLALKSTVRQDILVAKASPGSFFNFGGSESGLIIPRMQWPFPYGSVQSWWRWR